MRSALCLAISLFALPALAQTTAGSEQRSGTGDVADSACYDRLKETVPGLEQSLTGADQRDLRQLLRPAIILARRGNEAACEAILEEIESIGQQTQDQAQAAADPEQRRAALAGAREIGSGQALQAEELMDREVVTAEDEEIGEVEGVLIVTGTDGRAYAVIDRDGWFGTGGEDVVVPFEMLRITDEGEIVFNAAADTLEQAPKVDPDEIRAAGDLEPVDSYWGQLRR